MLVALISVQLFAVASSQADREKTFSRSRQADRVDKPAAEMLPSYDMKTQPTAQAFPVPRPPWSSDLIFPCSQCHARMQPPNAKHRVLTEYHAEIVLHHGESTRWCTDCHNLLKTATSYASYRENSIDFQSYRLCGQCHGDNPRLESRRSRQADRQLEWRQAVPALCPLPQPAFDPKFKALKPLCRHRYAQATRPD